MQGAGTAPLAFWGGGAESFETAARLAPTPPPCAALFPRPPSLCRASRSSHSSWGQDRGHPTGSPSPGLLHAKTIGVGLELPPLPTLGPPEVSLHPRARHGVSGWGRWRRSMPEGREVCRKLGLRRLVQAISSASPCISLSESLSLFPSVASAALRSLQEMILLPSLPFPVFLSPPSLS